MHDAKVLLGIAIALITFALKCSYPQVGELRAPPAIALADLPSSRNQDFCTRSAGRSGLRLLFSQKPSGQPERQNGDLIRTWMFA